MGKFIETRRKNFDFVAKMKEKVDDVRKDDNYKASEKDVMKGLREHSKEAMRHVFGEYKNSDKSKKSGKTVIESYDNPDNLGLADKTKFVIDKIESKMYNHFLNSKSTVMHRGEDYHLFFDKGEVNVLPAGEKHFETMEDLVVARVAAKMTEKDDNITKTQQKKAFDEYNTLKAKL